MKKAPSKLLRDYYRFQSRIYDATRWSFLFGRQRLVDRLPFPRDRALTILEVGCGTGRNLAALNKRFPRAKLIGMDLSADMLGIATKKLERLGSRVQLIEGSYGECALPAVPDLIVFSYCLTMVNPGYDGLIRQAVRDVRPGGYLAVVDFHTSPFGWFRRHMAGHHVRMEGQLLPILTEELRLRAAKATPAYGGIWRYFYFIGQRA